MTPLNLYHELVRICRIASGIVSVLLLQQMLATLSNPLIAFAVAFAINVLLYIAVLWLNDIVRSHLHIGKATIIIHDNGKTERLWLEGDARMVEKIVLDLNAKTAKEWKKE